MNFEVLPEPRKFAVGINDLVLSHTANVELKPDEVVTFVTEDGREYDVARKSWGYYATPSMSSRLRSFGYRTGIMRNRADGRCSIVLVEEEQMDGWFAYLEKEQQELVAWLDDDAVIERLRSQEQ